MLLFVFGTKAYINSWRFWHFGICYSEFGLWICNQIVRIQNSVLRFSEGSGFIMILQYLSPIRCAGNILIVYLSE